MKDSAWDKFFEAYLHKSVQDYLDKEFLNSLDKLAKELENRPDNNLDKMNKELEERPDKNLEESPDNDGE